MLERDQRLAVGAVAAELGGVHAGAEGGAGAGEDDAADLLVVAEALEGVGELEPQVDRERVAFLGALERDQRYVVMPLYREEPGHRASMLGGAVGEGAAASATPACGDRSKSSNRNCKSTRGL